MNRINTLLAVFIMIFSSVSYLVKAQPREIISLNSNWHFALGDASNMEKDYTHGTEYFTYLAKASSADHNRGPAWEKFDDTSWKIVNLPHDWVVDLPYSSEASHSHGYKQVGWRYPQNNVGWYRYCLSLPREDEGKYIAIKFEGIFRDAEVFCNGFYLGHERSGYATQTYNLTEYLNYGGDNIITVRCNASTEEGWYYEGGGIYRNVWLIKTSPIHLISDKVYYETIIEDGRTTLTAHAEVDNPSGESYTIEHSLSDATGEKIVSFTASTVITQPQMWYIENPYLYTLTTHLFDSKGHLCDEVKTKVGIRKIVFSNEHGLLLNGKPIELKGSNLHLDHAGTGVGIPDGLWVYKVKKMKELGSNAIRCSHNPASPAMLDVCDSLGMLVIDENRLMGTNSEHLGLLQRMIERDRNHPCVILWSIGNEEWAIESGEKGEKIARKMSDFVHNIDPTRLTTYGNSGGFGLVKNVDIHGYNYIIQNDVQNRKRQYPDWFIIGTEETSGCGTRNVYWTDDNKGWMKSINYAGEERSNNEKNVIERGWKFYTENPWAGGLFYWTGFDYRGEPNPMKWPATGSQFGILDYCGFPKDEAYYLRSWWTDEPVLHIFPHWNLKGHEGDTVEVWAYSNCDEVELIQDGKSLGKKKMPRNGHLEWNTIYKPGKLTANGYNKGKKILTKRIETTGEATKVSLQTPKNCIHNDGKDVMVVDITLYDSKNRVVPDACDKLILSVNGPAEILGWGNGDPGFKEPERPQTSDKQNATIHAFMGHAQVILRGLDNETGTITLSVSLPKGKAASIQNVLIK